MKGRGSQQGAHDDSRTRQVVATFLDPMGSFADHRAEHCCYFSLWSSKHQPEWAAALFF